MDEWWKNGNQLRLNKILEPIPNYKAIQSFMYKVPRIFL